MLAGLLTILAAVCVLWSEYTVIMFLSIQSYQVEYSLHIMFTLWW